MRSGERGLHHRLGHRLADAFDRNPRLGPAGSGGRLGNVGLGRQRGDVGRRRFSADAGRALDVVPSDDAALPGTTDRGQVHAEIFGELAYRRLGQGCDTGEHWLAARGPRSGQRRRYRLGAAGLLHRVCQRLAVVCPARHRGSGAERVGQLIMDLGSAAVRADRLARTAFGLSGSWPVADEVGHARLSRRSGLRRDLIIAGFPGGPIVTRGGGCDPIITCGGGRRDPSSPAAEAAAIPSSPAAEPAATHHQC